MIRKCLLLVLAVAFVGIGGVAESGIFARKSGFRVVTLRELVEAPQSYVGVAVNFRVRYRQPEHEYRMFHTSFTPSTHSVFSFWPEDARLWNARGRAKAIPSVFVSKDSPYLAIVRKLSKYQLVTISGTVKSVSKGLPCIEISSVSPGAAPLIDDVTVRAFEFAVNSVETNPRFALDQLTKILCGEDIEYLRTTPEDEAGPRLHFGFGMWLRNNWIHRAGSRLARWFNEQGIFHADDMSAIIITSTSRTLHDEPVKLDEQIAYYQTYWVGQDIGEK